MSSKRKLTAVVDFDNTLAGYDRWRGEKVIGPPVPYALDAVKEMLEWGWRVVVFTTRGDTAVVRDWLRKYNFPDIPINDTSHNPPGSSGKPIADVYFDDRDAHCVGEVPYNWHKAMRRVAAKYQPPLNTFVDDASLWRAWYRMALVAPAARSMFRSELGIHLDAEEVRQNDAISQADKEPIISQLYSENII